MKQVLLIALGLLMCDSVWAEVQGGKLSFEERQASTPMTVTSVNLSKGGGTITAEGDMGEYGRAYLTYLDCGCRWHGWYGGWRRSRRHAGWCIRVGFWHGRLLPGWHCVHDARDLQDQ